MNGERASPVCYGADADDEYMGYAGRDELLTALNELLEAERAGARVALASLRDAANPAYEQLMRAVHADEARWCAMLSREIRRLRGMPSRRCGVFFAKAMAIPDPADRFAFLNRGQIWVVRKLVDLMRRVREEGLHAELRAMLECHQENIVSAEKLLAQRGSPIERN